MSSYYGVASSREEALALYRAFVALQEGVKTMVSPDAKFRYTVGVHDGGVSAQAMVGGVGRVPVGYGPNGVGALVDLADELTTDAAWQAARP